MPYLVMDLLEGQSWDLTLAGDILVGVGAALVVAGAIWLIIRHVTEPPRTSR